MYRLGHQEDGKRWNPKGFFEKNPSWNLFFRRGGVLKIASLEGSGYLGLDPFLQKETIFPVDDNKIHPFVGMAK